MAGLEDSATPASHAELICCSNFSFQRGASHPQELVRRARELGYEALAIADECSLAGIVRAHQAARDANLKLIIGSQFTLPCGNRLVLLAPTRQAYTQLCALITRARRQANKGGYHIVRTDFEAGVEDCFGLWLPARHRDPSQVQQAVAWFAQLPLAAKALAFVHTLEQDSLALLERLRTWSTQFDLPVCAAGDVHYHLRERRRLHDVLTAVRLHTTVDQIGRRGFANGERHLRPLTTLQRLYPADTLQTAAELARRCHFSLAELHYEYPAELVPAGLTASEHLRRLTLAGCGRRWPGGTPGSVQASIEKELALIASLGYEHFFLTVEEIVQFARSKDILCQGRGSAANSVVCYALGITDVDPLRMDMLFERFISKERHEPPDIDVDFEHHRREEVIQHIYGKYGRHRAALAATVITYRRRSALRDVGRALGLPTDLLDALSGSLLWFDDNREIPRRLAELGFDPGSRTARLLLELAHELHGFPRHLSQHVGGFVISEQPLSTLVPVENAAMPDRTIIQWDKEDLEALGLLKVDCLSLGMLTALRHMLQLKGDFDGRPFNRQQIPQEDPDTYEMLCRGEAIGVFQVESRAQMNMLPRLKPRNYWDLVIQIAIIRPGPIQGGMLHAYLERRQNNQAPDALETDNNPGLQQILASTCGVPLFQEQVMQIAMVCAGFSAGEADQVRRSMAAWQRRGDLQQFERKLKEGMQARNFSPQFADRIFKQIQGFSSYGFPMSHSASFALLAYDSAWLRRHAHPAFVAGLLNAWPMGFYSPAQLVSDARRQGVRLRPVTIETSRHDCTLERGEDGSAEVRLGFKLIPGVAETDSQRIITARAARPFSDLDDLAHRAALDRRTLNRLARAGALAGLTGHRRQAHWAVLGLEKLPGALAGNAAKEAPAALPAPTEGQSLVEDYRSLGLTLGRHPVALLRERFQRLRASRAVDLATLRPGGTVRVAGIVTHRQRPGSASGVVFMSLEDETGIANLVIWSQQQERLRAALFYSSLILVEGSLQHDGGLPSVLVREARDCSAWLGKLITTSRDFH